MHPSWILDSIKAGNLLPVDQYLLYQGRKAAQKVLSFTSKTPSTCATTKPSPGGVLSVTTSFTVNTTLQSPPGGPSVDITSLCSTSVPPPMGEPSTSALETTTTEEQSETSSTLVEKDLVSAEKVDTLLMTRNSSANIDGEDFDGNEENVAFQIFNSGDQRMGDPALQSTNTLEVQAIASKNRTEDTVFKKPSTSSLPRAGDANFVSEFYSNSRLHYLSTWGAEFKKYTSDIIKSSASKGWKSRGTGRAGPHGRVIMHIDMDSFFVSVTLRDQPHLRGKPIAVCHAGKNSSATEQGEMR